MANKKPAIRIAVVLVVAILAATWLLSRRQAGMRAVSGTVEVDEVPVASRYGGRVEKISAQEGATLTNQQILIDLDAAELQARRDYNAAVLEELEHGPRPAEIDAAKHDWESLAAQLEFANAEAKRAEDLFAKKVNSATDLEDATSHASMLPQSTDAAQRRYDLLAEGTRPERITQARAQLEEMDAPLREMRIVAPGDTVLEVLSVKVGDVLAANKEAATLLYTQHLWVRVYVPEAWLGLIQVGQTVQDRVRQVFGVKIRLPSDTGKLRAGMSVDFSFPNVPPFPP